MPKFRKKPITIEAIEFTGKNHVEVIAFCGDPDGMMRDGEKLIIETTEGAMRAKPGDFVIKGVNGEIYPCDPDVFHKSYDAVGEETKGRPAVSVDFDGVIHAYSKGWHDGTCYDEPVPGAEEGLRALMRMYNVFILSTREPEQIQDWMASHFQIPTQIIRSEIPFWTTSGVIGITNKKLAAIAYIDDRAVPFDNWTKIINPDVVNIKESK